MVQRELQKTRFDFGGNDGEKKQNQGAVGTTSEPINPRTARGTTGEIRQMGGWHRNGGTTRKPRKHHTQRIPENGLRVERELVRHVELG